MKLLWSINIKLNARSDGALEYEKSTSVAAETPDGISPVKVLFRLATYVVKIYRILRSKFSS